MSLPIEEEWRAVPGYEGRYEVSSLGRVRSLVRGNPKLMKAHPSPGGYLCLGLRSADKVRRLEAVHRFVAMAFHGTHDLSLHARHLDGDQLNNRADNLAWGTHSDNMQDALRHGTNHRIRQTHCRNGHEYTPDNLRAGHPYSRNCRTCHDLGRARRAASRPSKRVLKPIAHGTSRGYAAHRRRGERPCDSCRQAHTEQQRTYRLVGA